MHPLATKERSSSTSQVPATIALSSSGMIGTRHGFESTHFRTLKHQLSPSVGTNFECEYIATTWHPFDFPMTPKFVKTMRERSLKNPLRFHSDAEIRKNYARKNWGRTLNSIPSRTRMELGHSKLERSGVFHRILGQSERLLGPLFTRSRV